MAHPHSALHRICCLLHPASVSQLLSLGAPLSAGRVTVGAKRARVECAHADKTVGGLYRWL